MKTLSSLIATPLLFQPQQTEVMFGSRFAAYCQRISPRVDRQREHVVGARAHVGDAVVDDRLREARVLRRGAGSAQTRAPHALELRDVGAIDRRQRRVALVVQVAAVRRPAGGRRSGQISAEKSRRALRGAGRDEQRGDSRGQSGGQQQTHVALYTRFLGRRGGRLRRQPSMTLIPGTTLGPVPDPIRTRRRRNGRGL